MKTKKLKQIEQKFDINALIEEGKLLREKIKKLKCELGIKDGKRNKIH